MAEFLCSACSYPSRKTDGCDNPACLANPSLSEAHKDSLRAMAAKAAKERAEWEAKKAFRARLKRSGFTPAL